MATGAMRRGKALRALTRHWDPRSAALWLEDLRRGVQRDAITEADAARHYRAAAAGQRPQFEARSSWVEVTADEVAVLAEHGYDLPALHRSPDGTWRYYDHLAVLPGGTVSDTHHPDAFELLEVLADADGLTAAAAPQFPALPQLRERAAPDPAGPTAAHQAPDPARARTSARTLTAAPAAPPAAASAAAPAAATAAA